MSMNYEKLILDKMKSFEEKYHASLRLKDSYDKIWELEDNMLRIENLGDGTGGRSYHSDPVYDKISMFFNNFSNFSSKAFLLTREAFFLMNQRKMNANQYFFLIEVSKKEFKKLARNSNVLSLDDMISHYKIKKYPKHQNDTFGEALNLFH